MSGRARSEGRCPRCLLHERACSCARGPRLATRTRVVLVVHRDEIHKPTNSGLLAVASLLNSEAHVRGLRDGEAPALAFDAETQPLLLFPHADAEPIARFTASSRPITLVVPDGTWRQAARVRRRVPGLAALPCVALPAEATASARIRAQPHDERLPTLVAIARALGILEGAAVRDALEDVFAALVERTLDRRGTRRTAGP